MADTLIGIVIIINLSLWAGAVWRLSTGRPLVAYQPRRRVPWGAADLLFALLCLLLFQALAFHIVSLFQLQEATRQVAEILAGAVGSLAAVTASAVVIFLNAGARWRDLGFDRRHIAADLQLGVVAFLMLAPPVYGIQDVLTRWFPSRHPLISLLTENGSFSVYLVVGFSAAIVAPLAEEYLFRVLLQGWIEGALIPRGKASKSSRQYSTSRDSSETSAEPDCAPRRTGAGWLAILVSATLFAALHASHGPDPIPLFMLAIGLGYLYQRTHRILSCITVHFLLNGVTLAVFLLQGE